ncbi:NlpC/P60 family protein [Methylobacterium sp. WL120]|uniref:C40 family peptidase n=1 Tax=Methylobacterium sp. WL120 TaxID=2603887 RepID=UPI0011CCDB22|nr:NlpC/P60 family protein [Methylobacterium sp. WL120]TXM64740.1 NlpC/P60 family protein [Methylobacterium sp. WL120]
MSRSETLTHDPRTTPARPDLADIRLRGTVEAARFVAGEPRQVVIPAAPLRRTPRAEAGLETEAVMGDAVTLYEVRDGFAWVQLVRDGYVGYLPAASLGPADPAPTHRVTALRSFLYPAPDMKRPALGHLSLGARIAVAGTEGDFVRVGDAFVFSAHCAPLDRTTPDYAGTAERLVGTPYLWGGRTSLGLDCSGLVQLCLDLAGLPCPRDADQQARAVGWPLPLAFEGLRRGDFVDWRGHTGLMLDADTLLHANGHHMAVAIEPLRQAAARIEANSYGAVTGMRRIEA